MTDNGGHSFAELWTGWDWTERLSFVTMMLIVVGFCGLMIYGLYRMN